MTLFDLDYKLIMKKFFWACGYYSRIEVDLSSFEYRDIFRRQPLTDIDVLAIQISPDFKFSYKIADCKCGKSAEVGRIFWIRGVMDFFGAEDGYIVHKKVPQNARELATKLGVNTMDEGDLAKIDKVYELSTLKLNMFDKNIYEKLNESLSNLKEPLRQVYLYIKYRYWIHEDHKNILNLHAILKKYSRNFDFSNLIHVYLIYEMITLYSMCLLKLCRYIFGLRLSDLKLGTRQYIFGGPVELRDKEQQIIRFNELLKQEDMFKKKSVLKIDPDYLPDLLEVVNRLLNKPIESSQILRYSEAVLYECILGRTKDLSQIFKSSFSPITLKLLKDIANFYLKSAGINRAVLDKLNDL